MQILIDHETYCLIVVALCCVLAPVADRAFAEEAAFVQSGF
jgi:hypothetical protein